VTRVVHTDDIWNPECRARVEPCTSFRGPRFRAIGERHFIGWDDCWKGPKRATQEEAEADATRWLDQKERGMKHAGAKYV
jgi:hypothetical protein